MKGHVSLGCSGPFRQRGTAAGVGPTSSRLHLTSCYRHVASCTCRPESSQRRAESLKKRRDRAVQSRRSDSLEASRDEWLPSAELRSACKMTSTCLDVGNVAGAASLTSLMGVARRFYCWILPVADNAVMCLPYFLVRCQKR